MKSPLSVLPVTVLVAPLCALAGIVVEPSFVDLGTVRTAERPVRAFALRNDGTNAVRLTELVRTCVCGTPTVGKRSLAPGEGTALRLALDPSLLPDGPFLKTFYVRTDDPQTPVVDVTVRGEVVPEWRVAPSRRVHLDAEASTAVFEVRDGAVPATFDRCAVQDAEGRPVDIPAQLTPLAGGGVRVAFTPLRTARGRSAPGRSSWPRTATRRRRCVSRSPPDGGPCGGAIPGACACRRRAGTGRWRSLSGSSSSPPPGRAWPPCGRNGSPLRRRRLAYRSCRTAP